MVHLGEWVDNLQHLVAEITGYGPSYDELVAGTLTIPTEGRHINDIGDDYNGGSGTPEKRTAEWAKRELAAKSPKERELIDTLGVWVPKGWKYKTFYVDDSRIEVGRYKGSHDPISYPSLTVTFDGESVVRKAQELMEK